MAPVQSARSVIHWEAAPSRPAGPASQPAREITPLCLSGLRSPRSSERHPVHLAHLSHPGHSVTQATLFTWLTWFPGCHIALLSHLVHGGHQVLPGTGRAAERPSRLGHQSPVSASLIWCLGRAAESEWSSAQSQQHYPVSKASSIEHPLGSILASFGFAATSYSGLVSRYDENGPFWSLVSPLPKRHLTGTTYLTF